MAQKTNLNVAPYYDDFNSANNFNRVLFRPGFAVQGRELTQLQTALQDQIRKHGDHVFEEGAQVLPGQISFGTNFYTLKLATQFNSENIDPSKYYNASTAVTITGATTGVKARVIGFTAGSTTEQPLLHIRYMDTGSDNVTSEFADGENISADVGITHTTSYSSNVASATTFTATSTSKTDPKGPASAQGAIANVESGIYYIRGMFVQNTSQTLVLSKYSTTPSLRVGFAIEEKIVTPEDDTSLLDNATGSSNFAAKGGHRLQINLTLSSLSLTSTEDDNFVELMKIKNGRMTSQVRITEYSVLEETLARRTFDESGDYTVRPFTFSTQESVTIDDNEGVYTNGAVTDDGNTAADNLLAFKVSPGKAYVKGFEIEKIAPTIKDVNKARDTQSVNNGATTFGLGNYTLVQNVYNTPDITADSGSIVEFGKVDFYEYFTATRGTVNTSNSTSTIGSARVRHFEYHSGTVSSNMYSSNANQDTQYKVYLFDIKPFTRLTMSGTISDTLVDGDKVTGSTSGATAFVQYQDAAKVFVSRINGDFVTGETLVVSDRSSATSETISAIRNYQFSDFKQMAQNDINGTTNEFTADLVQSDTFTLSGDYRSESTQTVAGQNQATTNQRCVVGLSGFNTSEVRLGDVIEFKQNTAQIQRGVVDGITSTAIGFRLLTGGNGTVAADNVPTKVIRQRSKLFDAEKNISVVKLPKDVIKTTSDIIYTVRRQHIITVASGVVTLPTLTSGDETYAPFDASDYNISMVTSAGSPPDAGDHMEISGFGGTDTARTLTYASITNGDVVKVIATVRRSNNVGAKTKTPVLSKALKVLSAGEGNFGIFSDDKDISLGRADVFKLQAIYDSESTTVDAVPPKLTLTGISGSFTRGEVITGGSSGAKARIITNTSPMYYVLTSETDFSSGEVITGDYGLATANVSTVTAGSTVITGNFTLDTGQRDNYYDIGRIVRKPSSPIPTGRLLVIYDYLEHSGSGDFFSVDSYVTGSTGVNLNPGIAVNQMDYNDIPTYSATKVDPDQKEPSGQFPLADCFDYRPRVADIAGTQTAFYADGGTGVDQITGTSFNFGSRAFTGTGSSSLNFPKPNTVINIDFDFYLNKRALVYINKDGEITVKEGASAEVPQLPKPNEGSMLLATLDIPAYTFEPSDVTVTREKNQRFTMKDIGRLKDRIENVEYYTALNMLERDAESFEVQDANGLSRFKSGFVVDNFSGHRVGDVNHVDYRVGMDFENGELRPIHHTEAIKLIEKDNSTTARTASNYQKTGDLLTLPYTEEQFTSQPYATTIEKVTPLLTSNWLGKLELTPSSDEWFETEIAPRLVINVEGNYNTFLAANEDKVGTVWNAWQTSWSGVVNSRRETRSGGRSRRITRVIETTRTNLTRRGIRTEVVPKVEEESQGFRKLYDTLVPFCRSTSIQFKAWGLKPNTKVFPFFDKKLVTAHVTPLNANFTSGTVNAGQPLVTDTAGNVEGTFLIPDPKVRGNLRFETGEVQFRLTSSATDALVPEPSTAADTIYFAKGILETHQETVIATRNAELVRKSVSQTTSKFSTQSRIVNRERVRDATDDNDDNNGDPLAQTFMVDEEGGIFITSIDLFFAQKDTTLPMWVEIRNVVNGYPGPKILPFGTKVLYPSDVTTSTDGSVATKVTFPSPVYVEGGVEYTIALLTAAQINTWSVYIAKMGEVEIGGDRTVSLQPHIGVLFKSHNNRAWAMSGLEDLKFNINRAKFNNNITGNVVLNNTGDTNVGGGFKKLLSNNPVRFTQGNNNLRISHRNHGMYDRDTNRVTIDGVSSGLTTTLSGAISNTDTTINLTDGTLFNETSGRYKHDSSNFHFIKIDDEIIKYTNASISGNQISAGSVTRGVGGTVPTAHSVGATVEYYQLFTVPLHTVNRTHTGVGDVEGLANGNQLDFYTVDLTGLTDFTAVAEVGSSGESINAGGKNVTATQNKMLDGLQTMIGVMELPETTITASCNATSGTSPSGTQSSFTKDSSSKVIPLNDNYYFDSPKLIASPINEQLTALNSTKSLDINLSLKSTRNTLSPVIDTQRMSIFAIGNRINKVTSSGAYTVSTNASPSTDPEGDDNAAIYCTKQILLENPATAIKMFFSGNVGVESDVVGMFKILRVDDASDFDDIGWQYFNTTGIPDTAAKTSLSETDFQQFMYTAGIKDDGLGTALEPFIGFAIKLILQGTNSAQVPRLKDFRAIALAT